MKIPAWLLMGPELGERKATIQTIKNTLQKKYSNMEIHRVYAYETPLRAILELLQNGTLFAGARLVIVSNADTIKKKDEIELLCKWIITPHQADDAFLILESDETSINKKIQNAIPTSQRTIFWELFENKKQDWVHSFFAKNKVGISTDAVESILSRVENNTDALKTTCSQIVLFFAAGTDLKQDDIEALLAHNREESPFSLFEALTYRKNETAIEIVQKLLLAKNSSAIQIIAGLSYCFRRLLDWHNTHQQMHHSDFDLKRLGFSSARARAQYNRAARLWNKNRTRQILALLNSCDMRLRNFPGNTHQMLIEKSIVDIAV